jgi:hypothetical protein
MYPLELIEKIGRRVRKKETRNAARTPHRALRLISLPPSERHVSWNPCRFLKGCDALAAPLFLSLAKHHEDAQRGRKKKELPEHHCMRRRAVPRPWRERNKGHAHLRPNTMTERHTQPLREGEKRRCGRPKSLHLPPKPTRRHCAPQPMLEVSQCRFRTKDKAEEREREQREEVAIPDPTQPNTHSDQKL